EIIPIEHRYRGLVRLPVATLTFSRFKEEAERLKAFILSPEGAGIFHKHAYSVGSDLPMDSQGFCLDGSTDQDMEHLVNAARALKDETFPANAETVGDFIGEVQRQRKTLRAGT
ncbi:MAG: hypothetical protein JXB25_12615, partial [Deltaproteobacteria bacterium]|nr:hypothetical protein [Deltaproteobacteria bacterium]